MMNQVVSAWRARQEQAHADREDSAIVRQRQYGADVCFGDGRVISLWEFALREPVMEVALRLARREGARRVKVEP
ncbi:MAG: hypothetical protein ACR2QQ_10705 [Gammaproteobacteria bacterium]